MKKILQLLVFLILIVPFCLADEYIFPKRGNMFSSTTGSYATSDHCIGGIGNSCEWIVGNQIIVGVYYSNPDTWGGSATWSYDFSLFGAELQDVVGAELKILRPTNYGKGLHSPTRSGEGIIRVNNQELSRERTDYTKCGNDFFAHHCYDSFLEYDVPASYITSINITVTVETTSKTAWDISWITVHLHTKNRTCTIPTDGMVITNDTVFCRRTYNLTNGVIINKSNVVLDCNNSVLIGSRFDSIGINIIGVDDVVVKNCNSRNYSKAIYLMSSNNSIIMSNNFLDNYISIYVENSNNNTIISNNVSDGYSGIFLRDLTNSTISHNELHSNKWEGLMMDYDSKNNIVKYNVVYLNEHGIYLMSSGNTVIYNNVLDNGGGITLGRASNNTIAHNNAQNNSYGIYLYDYSANNSILYNNVLNNEGGVGLEFSDNNAIESNSILNNDQGIYLWFSNNNTITYNNISNSDFGITISFFSGENVLQHNNISNNDKGIYSVSLSNTNYIYDNLICDNTEYDISDENNNIGDENICNTTFNWNDIGTVGCTYSCGTTSYNILLYKGWDLISIPLELGNKSVKYLFNKTNITIYSYKNNSFFIPEEIDNKLGYWLKVNESKNITLIGTEIEDKTLTINSGWNLVSYPFHNVVDINKSDLKNNTIFAYINNSWLSYIPNRSFNSLQTLKPGYGYWVKK